MKSQPIVKFYCYLFSLNSPLLVKERNDRSFIHSALPNLGSILMRDARHSPSLTFSTDYAAHLLCAVAHFLEGLQRIDCKSEMLRHLIKTFHNIHLVKYVNRSKSDGIEPTKSTNWFNKIEILLLLSIAKINKNADDWNVIDNCVQLQLAFRLLNCLSQELVVELEYLFDEIVFNSRYLLPTMLATGSKLQQYQKTYMDLIELDANKVYKSFIWTLIIYLLVAV